MALNLLPGAPPIFLTKNYFSGDAKNYGGTFTVSSNIGIGPRLFDMDPFAFWQSAGSSEGATETVLSQLYEGYTSANRVVSLIALLNINLSNFQLSYSTDGGNSWLNLGAAVSGNTLTNYIVDLSAAPVTMNAFRVAATNTIGAVAEKKIGTIVLCGFLSQPSRPPDKLLRRYFDNQRVVKLADGSEDITYIKRSPASHELYGCDLKWSFLPDADRDAIRTVRRATPAFCLYPEPGDRTGDLFYGRFNGDWKDEPTSQFKGIGNSVEMSFKETTS